MENILRCDICNFDYTHLLTTIKIGDNDDYETTEVIIDQKFSIPVKTKIPYRSQGNIHLLFGCEEGHYFIKSFDGHKGNVFIDENPLMDELVRYLNDQNKRSKEVNLDINFSLLGSIEKFLLSKKRNV